MFGSNVNNDQNNQHNVQEKRIHNENNIMSDFLANYASRSTTLTNYCLCTCCHKTDIPRSQLSYSKNQSTIMTILLL